MQVNKDGFSTAQLYKYTDNVLENVKDITTTEDKFVVEEWPLCLRNILIISIRPDRLKRCLDRLGGLSKYVTIIDGVNGEKLDMANLEEKGEVEHINELNKLTRGQVGCFLSHRKAWQHVVSENNEFGFILEDDCDLRPAYQTLELIQAALEEIKFTWDVLYVSRNPALCKVRQHISPHIVQVGKTWGLFAYAVTNKAASELLAASTTITGNAVDVFVSCTRKAARLKLAISPIPFIVVPEESDTVGIK
jgi:glycosyl transferase family 25